MRARSPGWLLLSLVTLSALVVAELQYDFGRGAGGRAERQSGAPDEVAPVPLFALAERESFSETLTRPLFMPNRQPPAPEAASSDAPAPIAAQPSAGRFALSAIIIVDEKRIALLTDTATGSLHRVGEGENVAGWRVEEIDEGGAVLVNGDNREELALRTFGPPPPRPEPAARRSRKESSEASRRAQERAEAKAERRRRVEGEPLRPLQIQRGDSN